MSGSDPINPSESAREEDGHSQPDSRVIRLDALQRAREKAAAYLAQRSNTHTENTPTDPNVDDQTAVPEEETSVPAPEILVDDASQGSVLVADDNSRGHSPPVREPKLSLNQRRLLAWMMRPEAVRQTTDDAAAELALTPATVKRIKADPVFRLALKEAIADVLRSSMPAVIDATIRSAMIPGRDGYYDRALLMRMSGLDAHGIASVAPEQGTDASGRPTTLKSRLHDAHARREQAARRVLQAQPTRE